jgi:phage shock protein C
MNYRNEYIANKTLRKDIQHKKLSGVCGGIARHYELPRLVVRVAAVLALLMFPVATGVAYLVAAILMPSQ